MRKLDMYEIVTVLLIVAIIGTVVGFVYNMTHGSVGKAAISINTDYSKARVLVNNKDRGETPLYIEDFFVGDIKVDINSETNSYHTFVKPAMGTLASIRRELGINSDFSSGQNIWFSKIGGDQAFMSVVSPQVKEVSVIVDGVEIGKTPLRFSTNDLLSQNPDNRYTITFRKDGYVDQEAAVKAKPGYELNIHVDMFLNPIPKEITRLEGMPSGVSFLNLSKVDDPAFNNKQDWAKAINYFLKTKGEITSDSQKIAKFNYFLDDGGQFYNENGDQITPTDVNLKADFIVGYLGSPQTLKLTQDAQKALEATFSTGINTAATKGMSVKISPTGIGFLRVRSGPGTQNAQIGQVNVGETFKLLDEKNGWYQIEYKEGESGWISGRYAKKLEPEKEQK